MKTKPKGQMQKIMRFNLNYLKEQIKRLWANNEERARFWYSAYKRHGGSLSLKEIVGGERK